MILQSTLSPSMSNSLSSTIPHPLSYPSGCHFFTPLSKFRTSNHSVKCSSLSHVYNSYGSVHNQMWSMWNHIYGRLSFEDPELEVASVLNQIEQEGKELTKWDLCTVAKELRKYKQFRLALEVYEWMDNRMERFRLSSGDTAVQLDLTAKVRGVSSAEDYFMRIPDAKKDGRIYEALLSAYVGSKERDKAESLMDLLRNKGYANHARSFNMMMTLYLILDEYDKIDQLISEMKQKNVLLDGYSYNIWLSAHEYKGSAEGLEHVLEQMKLDQTIYPKWAKFGIMASFYVKLGQIENAEDCLRNLETNVGWGDNMPYHHLMSLYGTLGKKEEVYRVWGLYKSKFPKVPNWGYHAVINACIRLGDIEGAEKFYQEWFQGMSHYDARIGNLLMGWYAREEPFEKAKRFFDQMIETGGEPKFNSWEILAEAHTKAGRISDALSCLRIAFSLTEGRRTWEPKLRSIAAFLDLCDREGDTASKDEFVGMLREHRVQNRIFRPILGRYSSVEVGDPDDLVMFVSQKKFMTISKKQRVKNLK